MRLGILSFYSRSEIGCSETECFRKICGREKGNMNNEMHAISQFHFAISPIWLIASQRHNRHDIHNSGKIDRKLSFAGEHK